MPYIGGDDDTPADAPTGGGALAVEDAYRCHAERLRDLAEKKFRIPPGDAEALVNEVFIGFLLRRGVIRDPQSWLVGAVCHASRGYWRNEAKNKPLPDDIGEYVDPISPDLADRIVDRVTVAAAVQRLPPKCRETLRLFYLEGYSTAEVAEQLDTTVGYVTQLLHGCRKRLRKIYQQLEQEKRG